MKVFFIFFISIVSSLRPASRVAKTLLPQLKAPSRSLHSKPVFPWRASPGNRFVELVLLSGDRMMGELDENMTIEQLKKIAIDQFKYRDVFDASQLDFVGKLLHGPSRSESIESEHLISMSDETTLFEVAPPLGALLQLSFVSPVFPDSHRYPFLFFGIEVGGLKFERVRPPRYRSGHQMTTISPNMTRTESK
jgi:hypothetical protein